MRQEDLQKYLNIISEFEMSDEAKTELIAAMLLLAQNFVDRAFGVDAAQLCVDKENKPTTKTGRESADLVC